MTFKKTFCPSPWFHMRISNNGQYQACRWGKKIFSNNLPRIQTESVEHYFQHTLQDFRKSLLIGNKLDYCNECYQQDEHHKVSGRQRQLLKIGVTEENFDSSLVSSPWFGTLKDTQDLPTYSALPVDWQIDLGNYCNSGCLFCNPKSSSTLLSDFKKLGLETGQVDRNWCDNESTLLSFVSVLSNTQNLKYLHFIGGETLITPAFKFILKQLVNTTDVSQITAGFTTNLTVWDDEIIELLAKFKQVNVGLSIESLHPINDYVRYPSKISIVKEIADKWVRISKKFGWLVQLRITPTILTVSSLNTIYDYAFDNNLNVESCNFLQNPSFMRPTVLPLELRADIIEKLNILIDKKKTKTTSRVVNTRNPNNISQQLVEDIQSYVNYLEDENDESFRLPELVSYLKKFEELRGNSVLDYLPDYEQIFRSAGY